MKKTILGIITALLAIGCHDEDKMVPNPKIYFENDGKYEIGIEDKLLLSPKIIYDRNSTYKWIREGEEVSTKLEYEFVPETQKDYSLRFEVANAFGADTFDISVIVRELIDFSNIDNATINEKASELVMIPNEEVNYLSINGHQFYNTVNSDTTFWGGFAYSSKTSVQNRSDRSVLGCAFIASDQNNARYAAVSGAADPVILFKEKYIVRSLDIANENFLAVLSKFGSEAYPLYDKGDYLKVRIYGVIDDAFTAKYVEHTLIDCDFDNKAKYFRQNVWETLDLRELGMVDGLFIHILSSVDTYPLLCCIDNIKLQKE